MRALQLFTPKFNPDASTPERVAFAREATVDAFGRHFPAEGSDGFRDRVPVAQPPTVAAAHFKRGRHRRLTTWRFAG